jgi:hypothetical protein
MCEWDMLSYEMWMKVIHEDGKRARDMGLEVSVSFLEFCV